MQRRWRMESTSFDVQHLSVSSNFVELSRKQKKRVRREKRILAEIWEHSAPERLWTGSFLRPKDARVTAPFGTQRVYNGQRRSRHLGIDYDGEVGEPILASQSGTVALARDFYFSGRTLIIDHGEKWYSLYFHLDEFKVNEMDEIRRGQVVGTVGKTGRVTGPHLHFAMKMDGIYINPEAILTLNLDDDPGQAGNMKQIEPHALQSR